MTKRPTYADPAVKLYAGHLLFEHLKKSEPHYLGDDFDETDEDYAEQCEKELAQAVACHDGFQAAKYLDNHGLWEVDAQLVEILDQPWMSDALRKAVEDWVKAWNITTTLKVGDRVSFKDSQKGIVEGEITEVLLKSAQAIVFVEALGHVRQGTGAHGRYVNWEDLTLVETP